eukprot:c512_g1_i1.p1 GENE.c512_g1_i1~~c512_g1_i1.p1  ORF type:complete len:356 (-),score=81.41 c512_g1_i1:299-1366(-)
MGIQPPINQDLMGSSPEDGKKVLSVQISFVVAFLSLNTILNMYNKYLFISKDRGGAGFTAPLFITMTHALAGFLTSWMATFNPEFYSPKPIERSWAGFSTLIAIAAFFSAGVGLNNSSLLHLPLSTAQMIKSTHPAVLAVCLYFVEGQRQSKEKIFSIGLLVMGVLLSVIGNQSATLLGVMLSVGSVLSGGLHHAFLSLNLGPKVKLNGLDVMYYANPFMIFFIFPAFLITSEQNVVIDFIAEEGIGLTLLLVIVGCITAVTYNLTALFFIQILSAIYMSVTGTVKVVLIIVLSIIFFNEHVSFVNALGIFVALFAFGYHSYLTYMEKANKAPKSPPAEDSEKEPLVKSEDGKVN